MTLFLTIFFSFPVIIFSALLILCILYWLVAAIGIFSIDCLDINLDMDIDGIASHVPGNTFAGLLMKFGFHKVPMTLIISLISLIGWVVSYLCTRYLLLHLYSYTLIYYVVSTLSLLVILVISIYITAWFTKPLQPFFNKLDGGNNHRTLLGQIVEIRSSIVNTMKGEAYFEDGGAGLILQVRSDGIYQFKRGDKAVLLSYDAAFNCYEIISIKEFNGH